VMLSFNKLEWEKEKEILHVPPPPFWQELEDPHMYFVFWMEGMVWHLLVVLVVSITISMLC
jgi:hypothetical protein